MKRHGIARTVVAGAVGMLLVAALAGCDESGEGASAAVTERDSAGIRIVDVATEPAGLPVYATVVSEPERSLGALEGPAEYVFSDVVAVRTMSDGSLLVADRGDRTLRRYDERWRHLRTMAGEGEGPGELQRLTSIVWAEPDSVVVFDNRTSRITAFDGEGTLLGTLPLDRDVIGFADAVRGLEGGAFVAIAEGEDTEVEIGSDFTAERETVLAIRLDPTGVPVDTAVAFPGLESAIHSTTQPGPGGSVRFMQMVLPLAFPRDGELIVEPNGVLVGGPNDAFEVRWWDEVGETIRILRWPAGSRPLAPEDVETRRRERMERYERTIDDPETLRLVRERTELVFENLDTPERWPGFSEIHLDDAGRLWASEYLPAPADGDLATWRVFSPEGHPLGTVETPPGLQILEIGRDRLLGVWKDEFDVPYVREHRIVLEGGR